MALMLSGFVLAIARDVPKQVLWWFKRQVMISVEVTNSDPSFDWLTLWLNEHPYTRKARRLVVSTQKRDSDEKEEQEKSSIKIIFSPSPGHHFLSYKKKWVWLSRERKDPVSGSMSLGHLLQRPEAYTFTMFGRSQQIVRELIGEAHETMLRQQEKGASVYIHTYSYWSKLKGFEPRPLTSVILPGNAVEDILTDIKRFLSAHEWYHERGIPYRRGYLFYGIPGSGKTSLIMGLSDELKMNIYVLSLGSKTLSDDALPDLMINIPPKSIILMEDIDAVVPDRETAIPKTVSSSPQDGSKEKKNVSLSCLLNCLDGVVAGSGSIVFMTSNHPDRLDPALIRPGRVDIKREFGYVQSDQATKLFQRFYPNASLILKSRLAVAIERLRITMADLQRVFLENKTDSECVVNEIECQASVIESHRRESRADEIFSPTTSDIIVREEVL